VHLPEQRFRFSADMNFLLIHATPHGDLKVPKLRDHFPVIVKRDAAVVNLLDAFEKRPPIHLRCREAALPSYKHLRPPPDLPGYMMQPQDIPLLQVPLRPLSNNI
jgi:hypothetical protein